MFSNIPLPASNAVAARDSRLNKPFGALRRSEANARRKWAKRRLAIFAALA
jgi:hypothetical protein